jgi:hypothetical protein
MNAVVMIHKSALPLADRYGPVWRKFGQRVIAHVNADCPKSYDWADETVVWGKDAGHNGIGQCRRHLDAIRIAASLEGPTAILDPDALVIGDMEVEDGVLYGSRLWDAWTFKPVKAMVTRWFLHPPYVATQKTWRAIHEVMAKWCENSAIFDEGHQDRILGLAANACNPPIRLEAVGFSRNTVAPKDLDELKRAIDSGVPLIHGVKNPEYLFYWLTKNKLMKPPTLWEEFGVVPDTKQPPMAMDLRHIEMLKNLLLEIKPKVAVEIGSFRGHSTTAFLKAMQDLPDMHLHVVEPAPTPELLRLIGDHPRVTLHRKAYWDLDIRDVSFCYIDGDHMFGALADTLHALANNVPYLVFHDTHSHLHKIGGCHGSYLAAKAMANMDNRDWFCDSVDRPGEWTKRGFGFSTPEGHDVKRGKAFTKIFTESA